MFTKIVVDVSAHDLTPIGVPKHYNWNTISFALILKSSNLKKRKFTPYELLGSVPFTPIIEKGENLDVSFDLGANSLKKSQKNK